MIAAVLALAALPIACGTTGDDPATGTDETRATPRPADPDQPLTPADERGRDLFVESCGQCHTLDAAGTQGSIGPDLDDVRADEAEVLKKIEEGPGAMPSNLLSGEDAQAVAAFVAASGG